MSHHSRSAKRLADAYEELWRQDRHQLGQLSHLRPNVAHYKIEASRCVMSLDPTVPADEFKPPPAPFTGKVG